MQKIKNWNFGHTIVMLLGAVVSWYSGDARFLLPIVMLSFSIFILQHWRLLASFQPFGGYANRVTLFRFGLLLTGAFFINEISPVLGFLIFLVVLCLDGIDGFLARKFDQMSDFGAYLDMETDAFFVAFLSTHWYLTDRVGGWILFVGFLRYIYVVALKILALEKRKEKSTKFAKTIAVIMMSALLAPFVLPANLTLILIVSATVLTIYSFGVSFASRVMDAWN